MDDQSARVNRERRLRILQTRPWEKSTGPKSKEGKARSSKNSVGKGNRTREAAIVKRQRMAIRLLQAEIMRLQRARLGALKSFLRIHELASRRLRQRERVK